MDFFINFLLVVKGETPNYSLMVSPYLQYTVYPPFNVNLCESNIDLHPKSHGLKIETIELCYRPGS